MTSRWVLGTALSGLLLAGCHAVLPFGGPSAHDGRPHDSARDRELLTGTDHRRDLSATERRPPDARSDASSLCDQVFGAAPGYVFCEQKNGICTFAYSTSPPNTSMTCSTMCAMFNGVCRGAKDNSTGCTAVGGDTCASPEASEICECSPP